MSKEPFSEVVYSKNVIEFATVANEYCSFIEAVDQLYRPRSHSPNRRILHSCSRS